MTTYAQLVQKCKRILGFHPDSEDDLSDCASACWRYQGQGAAERMVEAMAWYIDKHLHEPKAVEHVGAHIDIPGGVLIPIPGTSYFRRIMLANPSPDERDMLALHAERNQLTGVLQLALGTMRETRKRIASWDKTTFELDGAIHLAEEALK